MLIIIIIGIGKEKKMKVKELSREQLQQLKVIYLDNKLYEEQHRGISYGEIIAIDSIVSDRLMYKMYAGYIFTEDDFF